MVQKEERRCIEKLYPGTPSAAIGPYDCYRGMPIKAAESRVEAGWASAGTGGLLLVQWASTALWRAAMESIRRLGRTRT